MNHPTNSTINLIEALKLYHSNDIEEGVREIQLYIKFLFELQETLIQSKPNLPEYKNRVSTLASKTILNCNSLVTLLNGQIIDSEILESPLRLIDLPSIYALLRTQLENFLMFDFIYIQPKTEEEIEFKYFNWIYCGLLSRQEFNSGNEEFENKYAQDHKDIIRFREIIQNSQYLKTYTQKQQDRIIKGGEERLFNSWNELMKLSGFNEVQSKKLYRLLSAHAHSTGLSIINLDGGQLGYSKTHSGGHMAMFYSKVLLARFLVQFKNMFLVTNTKYNSSNNEFKNRIEFYSKILING